MQGSLLLMQLLDNVPLNLEDDGQSRSFPATHVGDLYGIHGPCLQPVPALAVINNFAKMNHRIEDLCAYMCDSAFSFGENKHL